MMHREQQALAEVARAALAWNSARLTRIATAKLVPPWPLPGYAQGEALKRKASAAEAKAKAALCKACAKANPVPVVIDAQIKASQSMREVQP